MSKKTSFFKGIIGIIVLVFFDQFTKYLAIQHLKGKAEISLIDGVLQLRYLENFGAAFGSLQNKTVFFLVLTVVFLGVLGYIVYRLPDNKRYFPLRALSVVFIAGALGNFIDRLLHQYVVDFIYFSLIDFPIFNVADIYVTCSCVVFILFFVFYYKDEDFSFLKKTGR